MINKNKPWWEVSILIFDLTLHMIFPTKKLYPVKFGFNMFNFELLNPHMLELSNYDHYRMSSWNVQRGLRPNLDNRDYVELRKTIVKVTSTFATKRLNKKNLRKH